MFTVWFTIKKKKCAKEKKKMTPFWGKKTEEKQNNANTMISVDGKWKVFPVKGIVWKKHI